MKSCATPDASQAAGQIQPPPPVGQPGDQRRSDPPVQRLAFLRPLIPLVAAACIVIVVGGMRVAAPLLTQLLMVAFTAIVLSPLYDALRRLGFPSWAAVLAVVVGLAGVCVWALVYLLPPALLEFSKNLPSYHAQLSETARNVERWLSDNDVPVPRGYLVGLVSVDAATISHIGKTSLAVAGGLLKNGIIVLVVVAFLLSEMPRIPAAARSVRWLRGPRWELLVRFAQDVRHYMGIKTAVSAATGLVIYAGLRLFGVDSPVLLGVLAFLLNFVPAIGSVIAAVPGVLLALGSGGAGVAAATAVLYLSANQILGNIVEPRALGAGFGVSPVVVLLSAVFWGWVLGPVGMLLAVPLTMAVRGTLLTMVESHPATSARH